MKKLLLTLMGLLSMTLPLSAAVDGKFSFSYPSIEDLPYNLGYQYSTIDLGSKIISWEVMELKSPLTLTYQITSEEDKTVEVVFDPSYLELKDIVIPGIAIDPATGTEYTVTAIGKMAFDDCPEIRSVIMSDSITRIGDYAFNMCENKVLHQIGYIKFSKNLTHIGNYAFRNCHNLTTGYYKEGNQYQLIGIDSWSLSPAYPTYGYAARLTGLDDYLLLPASVEYIGKHAFEGCYFEDGGNDHKNYGLCKVKIPNPSCVIDDYAFAGCKFLELITIGEELNYDGLKYPTPDTTKKGRIGNYAFADCNLMRLDIPSSIESIGENAFINCFHRSRMRTSKSNEGRVYFDDVNWFFPRSLFNNETDQWHNWNFFPSDDKGYVKKIDDFLANWHTNTVTIHSDKTEIGTNAFADNPCLEKVIIKDYAGEIGSGAFRNCTQLKRVELPDDLAKISSSTFMNCSVLDSLTIPDGVTEIGDSAFYKCKKLYTFELPSKLENVNPYTFYGCELLNLTTLPDKVNSIGNHAFYGCENLTTFTIPGSVRSIGDYAFAECYIHEAKRRGDYYGLVYGLTQVTIGDGVTSIGAYAFDGCRHLGQIDFGNSVKTIGDYAFRNCMSCPEDGHDPDIYAPSEVNLPNSLATIGTGAFQGCSHLPGIDLSEGLTTLPDFAFAYCSNLSSVTNTSTIESISTSSFLGCYNLEDLDNFYAQDGLIDGIFYDGNEVVYALPNIQSAIIREGVTKIRDGAFADCGALSSIEFPESLLTIGSHAFQNCVALEEAELFDVEMGDSVYAGCTGIQTVIIHSDFNKGIKDNWFAGCLNMNWIEVLEGNQLYTSSSGLLLDSTGTILLRAPSGIDYIEFPESVTTIGDYACSNCILLYEVEFPETVTHIGAHAFDGCSTSYMWYGYEYYSGLESVVFYNPAVTIGEYAFNNCKGLSAVFWDTDSYSGELAETDVKGSIGAYAFSGCESLNYSTDYFNLFSAYIGTLEPYAFANNPGMAEIELPESLETIGDHAFDSCPDLTSVVFPETLDEIGAHAFANCPKLTSVDFPEGLKRIGNSAFKSTGLKSLTLPDAIEEIGDSAFMNCSEMMELKLPSSLKKINPYTFYNCFSGILDKEPQDNFNLSIEIPAGVKSIGEYAFYGCAVDTHIYYSSSPHDTFSTTLHHYYKYGLSSVSIGDDVETIGAHAFDGCGHLLEVKMGSAVTSIGDYAFRDCFKECFKGVREVEVKTSGVIEKELDKYPVIWEHTDYTPQPISLPESLTSLGEGAFSGCAELPAINFPGCLESIPDQAFNGCKNLAKIELPEGIGTIGTSAFGGCKGVTEISIPASLEQGSRVFVDCDSAFTVYYHAEAPKAFDEAFFSPKVYSSKKSEIHAPNAPLDSLKGKTPWALFYRIIAKDDTLVHLERVLETKNGLRFRVLANKPQPYCEVAGPTEEYADSTSFVVPREVLNTDETSPYYNAVYTVIRIGNDAFENNLNLKNIEIPETVFDIGQEAFNGCKNLSEINLPESITNMGERAFANCYGLTYFEVPPLVTRLNPEVLKDCRGLYSIRMHDNIEELCMGALMDCRHLRKFERSENWKLKLIDDYALKNCIELEEINIPEGVIKIGKEAMYYCQKLKTVSLPKSLEHLGENTFDDCEVLTTIKVFTETPPQTTGERNLTDQSCKIYVQAKCLDDYKNHWKVHENRIEPGIVMTIPSDEDMPEYIQGDTYMIRSKMPLGGQSMTWSTSNDVVATPHDSHDGTVLLNTVGRAKIKVETNEKFYHECVLDVYPQLGDANWDGAFDISDAVNIANYAVLNQGVLTNWWKTERTDFDTENIWKKFYVRGADVNKDGAISFADASASVKVVLAQNPVATSFRSRSAAEDVDMTADALLVGAPSGMTSQGSTVPVRLAGTKEYVALQANIRVAPGARLESVKAGLRADGHALSTRRIDDRTMRVVLFDLENKTFADSAEPILELVVDGDNVMAEDVEIFDIVASDIRSASHTLTSRIGSGLSAPGIVPAGSASIVSTPDGLMISDAAGKTIAVYTVDGRVLRSFTATSDTETIRLNAGIYIVSVDDHSYKIAVK